MDLESRMREKSHCGVCGKNDCQCVANLAMMLDYQARKK